MPAMCRTFGENCTACQAAKLNFVVNRPDWNGQGLACANCGPAVASWCHLLGHLQDIVKAPFPCYEHTSWPAYACSVGQDSKELQVETKAARSPKDWGHV